MESYSRVEMARKWERESQESMMSKLMLRHQPRYVLV